MNIEEFRYNFASCFEETKDEDIKTDTKFKEELDEWDSLTALAVIAMVDSKYYAKLQGDDIEKAITVEGLYDIVRSKTHLQK